MTVSGTKEWSVASVNAYLGCEHGCEYCFARANALRFKRITDPSAWRTPVLNRKLAKECKLYPGTVMFPSTHDITPATLQVAYEVLYNLLEAGNRVLIVTKPHFACVRVLCDALTEYREQILWRFTIGCLDGEIVKLWEPYAPHPFERLRSLDYAHRNGYQTSVSMEPMLNPKHIVQDFEVLEPYVTDSIWLGKMNHIRQRVAVQQLDQGVVVRPGVPEAEIARIESCQTDADIRFLYEQLKDRPKVKWKESIKQVVGLPLETEAGTDR
jgi:hypothetical protein